MKIIIIDDEARSRKSLRHLLTEHHASINILGEASNIDEGLIKIHEYKPDLIFLDIQMPGGDGFELLSRLTFRNFQVIFITAHDKYAVSAIKFGALDYLLKPIDEEDLARAIEKAKRQKEIDIFITQIPTLLDAIQELKQKKLPTRQAVPTIDGIHLIEIKDIIRLEASRNYTNFILANPNKDLLASQNLGEYEEQFELYDHFVRTHKSHLVNLYFVETYVKADGGYLVLKNGDKIGIGRMYKEDVWQKMSKI